ncbi:MAG: hypothetical protein GC159_13020, partial [Phycisphaera sp.]|nr:hypothetical protein [Phycisphaera sp.]
MSEGGSTRTDGRVVFAACILIYTLSGAAAATDKATELFESLYGDAYKAAVVSPSPDDDVTLAAQLLDAAKVSAADHPDLVKLLCEKAVELGRKDPGGYGSAIAALNILIERFPADAYLHQPQVVELYQAWFIRSRGDEKQRVGRALLGQLVAQAESERRDKRFNDADKTYRRALAVASGVDSDSRKPLMDALQSLRAEKDLYDDIDKAKAVLQVNPDDAEAKKKLLYAYLLELDDPKEAVKYADADPKAKVMLSMMTGDTDVLSPLAWLDLADWQSALADQTSSADAKVRMLSRSHRSYQKFLAEHQE